MTKVQLRSNVTNFCPLQLHLLPRVRMRSVKTNCGCCDCGGSSDWQPRMSSYLQIQLMESKSCCCERCGCWLKSSWGRSLYVHSPAIFDRVRAIHTYLTSTTAPSSNCDGYLQRLIQRRAKYGYAQKVQLLKYLDGYLVKFLQIAIAAAMFFFTRYKVPARS